MKMFIVERDSSRRLRISNVSTAYISEINFALQFSHNHEKSWLLKIDFA